MCAVANDAHDKQPDRRQYNLLCLNKSKLRPRRRRATQEFILNRERAPSSSNSPRKNFSIKKPEKLKGKTRRTHALSWANSNEIFLHSTSFTILPQIKSNVTASMNSTIAAEQLFRWFLYCTFLIGIAFFFVCAVNPYKLRSLAQYYNFYVRDKFLY